MQSYLIYLKNLFFYVALIIIHLGESNEHFLFLKDKVQLYVSYRKPLDTFSSIEMRLNIYTNA